MGNRALNFHVSVGFFLPIAVLRKLLHIIEALKCILTLIFLFTIISSQTSEIFLVTHTHKSFFPIGFSSRGRVINLLLRISMPWTNKSDWTFLQVPFCLLPSSWFDGILTLHNLVFLMFTRFSHKNEFSPQDLYTHTEGLKPNV